MSVSETVTTDFVEAVADSMESKKVFVFCKAGVHPLEWPKKEDGTKSVDRDQYAAIGNKAVIVSSERYRNIVTRLPGAKDATSPGYEVLDMGKPEDVEFLARLKDYIANSNDPRIEKRGIRIEEGNPYPPPFNRWNELTAEACAQTVENMLGTDAEENRTLIAGWIKHELSNDNPNTEKLDFLNYLAGTSGAESYDDSVEDETA